MRLFWAVLALGLAGLTHLPAQALGIDAALTQSSFRGPAGFQALCVAQPSWCAGHDLQDGLVHDDRLDLLLQRVQRQVHDEIEPIIEPFGQDLWLTSTRYGDCEDYALRKYQLLLDAGLARSDMRFALGFTEQNEFHAVLIVETSKGSIVLDNRFDEPRSFAYMQAQGYRWIAAQKRGQPTVWAMTADGIELAARLSRETATSQVLR